MVYRWVADGRSPHFTLDESRLAAVAGYVADVTRDAYPDLKIPYHSRWRHFSAGGVDRWGELAARRDADALERARIAVDLATVSVLLDAGAGERLALPRPRDRPCLRTFGGACGCQPRHVRRGPLLLRRGPSLARRSCRACAHRCRGAGAPLSGRQPIIRWSDWSGAAHCCAASAPRWPSGRICTDMRRRGRATWSTICSRIADRRRISASSRACAHCSRACRRSGRPGSRSMDLPSAMPAGIPPCARGDATDRIVPFHKLSQWLTYSLLEPLEAAGLARGEARRAHRACRISQRRAAGRSRRDPRRAADRSDGAPRGFLGARRRMARADSRVDGPTGRFGARTSWARMPPSRMPQLLQGGTWSAGARSRSACVRRTARRRYRSPPTARCSESAALRRRRPIIFPHPTFRNSKRAVDQGTMT